MHSRELHFFEATSRFVYLRGMVVLACAFIAISATAQTNSRHFFWAPNQPNTLGPSALTNDLIYHGGNAGGGAVGIETVPATYLIFWGSDWANGFTTTDASGVLYTSQQLQIYVTSFLSNLGGTSWAAIQTEYCDNVPSGTTSCEVVGDGSYVTNPRKQLKGVWTDATPVPENIFALELDQSVVDDPLATEAIRASEHFNYDSQATYIILTPPATIAPGQPVYCGYHTQTNSVDEQGNPYRLQYAFIPFLNMNWPGLGQGGCGMNSVNVVSDDFGHGVFDSYSIVVGHEYADAVIDSDNFATIQEGWSDAQGNETGDKCAWTDLANVSMNNHTFFAVQPLWSNRAFDMNGKGCVRSAVTNPQTMRTVAVTASSVGISTNSAPAEVAAGQSMPTDMVCSGGKLQANRCLSSDVNHVNWDLGEQQPAQAALAGGMDVPAASTYHNLDAVEGIIQNNCNSKGGTTCNAVAGYFAGTATANNAWVWGTNPVAQDTIGRTNTGLVGEEVDVNVSGKPSVVYGISINGFTTGTMPLNSFALNVQGSQHWQVGLDVSDGAILSGGEALLVGAKRSSGKSIDSNNIQFDYFNSRGREGFAHVFADSAGYVNTDAGIKIGTISKQIILNGNTNATTISVGNPSTARTDSIPDVGSNANFGLTFNRGGAYQTKRSVEGCKTSGGTSPFTNPCTTTLTFPASFPDTDYTVTCTGNGIGAGVPILQGITAKSNRAVKVQTQQATGVNASFSTIECIAVHD